MIVVDRATYIDNLESGGKNTINGDKKIIINQYNIH